MKKYFKLLMVALFATLSFTLVSCGDDDDDDNGALVGTWEASWVDEDGYACYDVLTFTKDGKYTLTETQSYQGDVDTWTVSGVYTVSGDVKEGAVVHMAGIDADGDPVEASIPVRVEGDKLYTVTDPDYGEPVVFTKK